MNQVSDYDYDLPPELIAQYPADSRTASRLLKVDSQGQIEDLSFPDILQELSAGDVLVLNNTRVVPARVYGHKESGGRIEFLLERIINETTVLAQIKASRAPKIGQQLILAREFGSCVTTLATVIGREESFFKLEIHTREPLVEWFEKNGHVPLPPYIDRVDDDQDLRRYQTVFARHAGAVAAPTAGLHFDEPLLAKVRESGVEVLEVTLHVGAGTYQPVRVDNIHDHVMHSEWVSVSQETCDKIHRAKQNNRRIIAVGTTVVRALESAAQYGELSAFSGETAIFIYPGFKFKVIDSLLTNFHLPQSTLLMLVSAFIGRDYILRAYQHAIAQKYRFFSYGDAMIITR